MRSPTRRSVTVVATAVAALLGALAWPLGAVPAGATPPPVDGVPQQSDCDSGSVTPTWPQTGLTERPHLLAVAIDGEAVDVGRLASPQVGEIGAAICAQDADRAKNSALTFYRRTAGGTSSNLTGAVTPGGRPISASTQIDVALAMGDLSPAFTFATVFGRVNAWNVAGLRTGSATLLASFTPADGVIVDGRDGSGNPSPEEEGCTRQPPDCDPLFADADVFSLGMQFKAERADRTAFAAFAGGYFALQSAVGGFVQPKDGGLDVTIAGPHFRADGSTLNVGSMTAFLPDLFLSESFGLAAGEVTTSTFAVLRQEGGTETAVPWTYRVVPGGIAVDVTGITFSSPRYSIVRGTTMLPSPAPRAWPAPPFFHTVKRGRTVTAGFAAAPGGQYVVTYTNLERTYQSPVTSTVPSWRARWTSRKLTRGAWLVIVRQRIGDHGWSEPAYQLVRV